MKRLSSIFQAKSNAALNKMEDPRQTLDLSYEQQLDNLTKVRRAIADGRNGAQARGDPGRATEESG